jgi:hypothetical protein
MSLFPEPSSPRVALGEGFPECNWHPGKTLPPVVWATVLKMLEA